MPETICKKCGSDLVENTVCNFCQEVVDLACHNCDYISEEKVHADCIKAEFFTKNL